MRALTVAEGGAVEHPEFIVYKDSQVLPEYLITYTHKPLHVAKRFVVNSSLLFF